MTPLPTPWKLRDKKALSLEALGVQEEKKILYRDGLCMSLYHQWCLIWRWATEEPIFLLFVYMLQKVSGEGGHPGWKMN